MYGDHPHEPNEHNRATYDQHGNMVNQHGDVIVPNIAVSQYDYFAAMQEQQRAYEASLSAQAMGRSRSSARQTAMPAQTTDAATSPAPQSNLAMGSVSAHGVPGRRPSSAPSYNNNDNNSNINSSGGTRQQPRAHPQPYINTPVSPAGSNHQAANARRRGLTPSNPSAAQPAYQSAHSPAAPSTEHAVADTNWARFPPTSLPQENFFSSSLATAFDSDTLAAAYYQHNFATQNTSPQQHAHAAAHPFQYSPVVPSPQSCGGGGQPVPAIRIPSDPQGLQNFGLQQPQAHDSSISPVSSAPYTPEGTYGYSFAYNANNLSPNDTRLMAQTLPEVLTEQQTSGHQHASISPGSPGGHHSPHQQHDMPPPDGETISRKRSWNEMDAANLNGTNGDHELGQRSRANSATSGADQSGDMAGYSPRPVRITIRRDDPPTNEDNKYICNISSECTELIFDRKCEWSKHMDKHDRPYRCAHPQCAKLQGFTYSGGLLRHEREVHGKHGGPKTQLMCPYEACKRHSGKGFTRKENLNEHIRRVHSNKDEDPSTWDAPSRRDFVPSKNDEDIDMSASAIAPELQSPEELAAMAKRRRVDNGDDDQSDVADLKLQIMRLRNDHVEKDAIIQRMQQAEAQQLDRLRMLEETVRQLQAAHQPAAAQMQEPQPEPEQV